MRLLPQEPSAAGFMLISFLYSLILCPLSPPLAALALGLFLLHFLTFDVTFMRLKASLRRALPFLTLNVVPYLLLPFFVRTNFWVLLIPAALILSYLYLSKSRDNPHAYILGSAIPTVTAFTVFFLAPRVEASHLVFWYALAVYVSATAAYIESKLPWRKVSGKTGLLVWTLSLPVLLFKPFSVVAFVEPTVKFVRNAIKVVKIDPREIKKLGWVEMSRFLLYSTLLLIIFKLF